MDKEADQGGETRVSSLLVGFLSCVVRKDLTGLLDTSGLFERSKVYGTPSIDLPV